MFDQLLSADLLLQATVIAEAGLLSYIVTVLVTAAVLIGCAYVLPGVHIDSFVSALILAVIVGLLTGRLSIFNFDWLNGLTLGIWSLIIAAVALVIGDKIMDSVRLDGFVWALAVAAILALVNGFLAPTLGTL